MALLAANRRGRAGAPPAAALPAGRRRGPGTVPPASAVAVLASPRAPAGCRSCVSQPKPTAPSGTSTENSFSRAIQRERKSRAFAMSTRSGAKCSIREVSTKPPWMPCRASAGLTSPSGLPRRLHMQATANICDVARSRRQTMSTTCGCPPRLFSSTSLRTPARATLCPILVQSAISVSALAVSVPGKRMCSTDSPMACTGSTSSGSASGSSARVRVSTPSLMVRSTETGRCGPCCSMAATGRTATVSRGRDGKAVQGRSCQ